MLHAIYARYSETSPGHLFEYDLRCLGSVRYPLLSCNPDVSSIRQWQKDLNIYLTEGIYLYIHRRCERHRERSGGTG
ncbi:MAG: hypothetical protein QOJ99_2789 [Bryobacterales bacterium]|nr:hypothetical protein [Bryobacterales bacterium]